MNSKKPDPLAVLTPEEFERASGLSEAELHEAFEKGRADLQKILLVSRRCPRKPRYFNGIE